MNLKQIGARDSERRKKRLVLPIVYFIAEGVFFWLVLSLIQLEFSVKSWSVWAILVFIVGLSYSIMKTINVFERQKDYSE